MCLASVDKVTKTNIKYAYKTMTLIDNRLLGQNRNAPDSYLEGYELNKWYDSGTDESIWIASDDLARYEPGFHSFIDYSDANLCSKPDYYVIVKVEIDDIVASGDQYIEAGFGKYGPCIVSRKIKIVEILS